MRTVLLRLAASVLAVCLLSACPETTVDQDFGLKPLELQPGDWNGLWTSVDEKEKFQFTVIFPSNGVLRLSDPDDKKEEPSDLRLHRATADDKIKLCFALMQDQDDKETKSQVMLMRQPDEGVILAWTIDDLAVEKALKAGQLKGTTQRVKDDPHNHLATDPANHTKLLEPQFWNWSEPVIFKRVGKQER
jgi:hypothetical protein